jgi:hypothetical protein
MSLHNETAPVEPTPYPFVSFGDAADEALIRATCCLFGVSRAEAKKKIAIAAEGRAHP